ncbi:hypothetical protein [Streptomyces mangrovisoli]|uniref:hypothetical protein n=1 Tax=Streptomyces mangrovisoli TaxID=1428628 RepID=UPI0011608056|nr:hypothetical protein [Streptomyces mangrovisoli]
MVKLAMNAVGIGSAEILDGADGAWRDFVRDLTGEGESLEALRSEVASVRATGVGSMAPVRVLRLMRIRFVLREFLRSREHLTSDAERDVRHWAEQLAVA